MKVCWGLRRRVGLKEHRGYGVVTAARKDGRDLAVFEMLSGVAINTEPDSA